MRLNNENQNLLNNVNVRWRDKGKNLILHCLVDLDMRKSNGDLIVKFIVKFECVGEIVLCCERVGCIFKSGVVCLLIDLLGLLKDMQKVYIVARFADCRLLQKWLIHDC